jgi:hypothetical protein
VDLQVRVIECCGGNDDVCNNAQCALEVIALSVLEEVAHNENSEDHNDDGKEVEVQTHVFVQTPADDDSKRCVKERCLDGCSQHVRHCEIHAVVPSLVDGGDVLRGLLDEGDQDETHEKIRHAVFLDDVGDFLHEIDGHEGNEGDRDGKRDDAFGESKLGLVEIVVVVFVFVLIVQEDRVVDAVVCTHIKPYIEGIGDYKENGGDARSLEDRRTELLGVDEDIVFEGAVKSRWDDQAKATED